MEAGGTDAFSRFQNELSGLFFFLGSADLGRGIKACKHTPTLSISELLGVSGHFIAIGVKCSM